MTKNKLYGLKQYKDYCIESELSTGDKILSFLYPLNLSKEIKEEGYIRNKTDEFVIKEVSTQGNWKSIKAKLNVEDLEGKVFESFDTTNETITDCINLALAGTGWIVGTCDVTRRRTVRKTNSSSWDIIQEARKVYRCELEFDTLNKKVNIYEKRGIDKGVYFLDSLNLKDLSIQSDSYDFYTRIIAKGKDNLKVTLENFQYSNKIKTYIWKDERYTNIESLTEDAEAKLDELSKPYRAYSATIIDLANISKEYYKDILSYGLGDVITLVSKENGIKEKQRIVKMVEYPDEPTRNTCEIANTTLSFEDVQKEFQDTSDTVNNITTDNGTVDGSTINGISTEQIYDFEDSVGKITDLTVVNARIDDLYANKANISELNAVIANVAELNATKANITDLNAINANIQNLIAADATINNALIGKADITELNAVKGTINVLESDTANIKNLLAGNISGESGQLIHLTASNVVIADAVIKDLIASNISVQDLKASTISTNKFTIASTDGGLSIVGPTMQFKDRNNKVRIQMGQDATGNFNFILRGEDGTTTLIDHTGIKEKAIADNLIKENMVAADAIGEKQINYSSLITGLNKDTNTQLIKASKVAIDLTGQSLEIAFNSLKSNVDNMQIGGRNIIRKDINNISKWSLNYPERFSISNVEYDNTLIYKTTGGGWETAISDGIAVIPNKEYVLSFEYEVFNKYSYLSGETFRVEVLSERIIGNSSKYKAIAFHTIENVVTPRKRVYITFTPIISTIYLMINGGYIADGLQNLKFSFNKFKLETGNKATDWIPAPEDIDSKIESNSTTIGVMQGQITTAINNTQIVKDGQTVLLKDDYNRTVAKVDSINSTIGTHTTKLNELTGSITSVDTKVNSVQRDLEGTKSTVSSHSTSISDLSSKVSTQGSSISQLQTQIALKVEQTDITNAINNINIGTENLIKGSKDFTIGSTRDKGFINSGSYSVSKDSDGFSIATKSQSGLTSNNIPSLYSSYVTCSPGDTFTVSVWFKVKDVNAWDIKNPFIFEGYDTNGTRVQYEDVSITNSKTNKPIVNNDEWCYITYTGSITNSSVVKMGVRLTLFRNGEISFKKLKIEKGNKATDWSPAYEDVDSSIANIQTQVTTTNNKVATIETNLSSITQRVSSTESTVSTHTSQLSTVDSRINTAKNSAISTAASDATNKANNALTSAKSYTDGQITTVNQTITNKVAEIKTTTDSITQRVSSTESKITTVTATANTAKSTADSANSKIDSLKIGSRNLFKDTRDYGHTTLGAWNQIYGSTTNTSEVYNGCKVVRVTSQWGRRSQTISCEPNTEYVISAWVKGGNTTTTIQSYCNNATRLSESWSSSAVVGTSWKRYWAVWRTGASQTSLPIRIEPTNSSNCDLYICGLMVEKGNKASDWSPAPEDVDNSISNVQSQVTTTSNKVATIETNLSSITSRVSSTESSITTINGNVTSLQSRMTTAEQKITPTAITTTISSVITGGTGSISTTQFVMDKNGLTIKNGALTIKNKSGTTVLNSDTSGNLIITGEMRSQYGQQWVGLNAGGLTFQDSQRNEQMLRVGLAYYEANRDMNGIEFAMPQYSDFIRFSHISKADLNNGWSSSDTSYNFFELWSGTHTFGGSTRNKGMTVNAPLYINKGIKLYSGTNHLSEIGGAASWNNGTGTVTNMLGVYGDNGAILGYKSGEDLKARFLVTEGSHPGTGDNLISWGNYNFNGYTFHNAKIVATSLSVSGSKNCLQETLSYGSRLINAYETAEYYFGDLGFARINEDGECLVSIDDTFLECVNTNAAYHVFTQIYNGSIKTIERYKTYFIVKGEPGTSFSWELKAKRIGYENNRLDTQEIETQGENKIELFGDEDFKVKTSENTLMDVLTFELENLLLMEG